MLQSISITNFKSIKHCFVDLGYHRKAAPKGYRTSERIHFVEEAPQHRAVPIMALYGANASGKSNIIEAIWTLVKCVKHGVSYYFSPNLLLEAGDHTEFSVSYVQSGLPFEYCLAFGENGIIHETLKSKGKILFQTSPAENVFNISEVLPKTYHPTEFVERYKSECYLQDAELPHETFLKMLGKYYPMFSSQATEAYLFFANDLLVFSSNRIPTAYAIDRLAEDRTPESLQAAFRQITDYLQKFDISISRMEMKRKREEDVNEEDRFNMPTSIMRHNNSGERTREYIYTYHLNEQKEEIRFNLRNESAGTKLLFGIIALMLVAHQKGATLIFDELDRSIHPILLRTLVHMHTSRTYNKSGAQLVFTAHATEIMGKDCLFPDEISFITKYGKHGTTVNRLEQLPLASSHADLALQYLRGDFSAIPYPYY